ncbi:MAG TPA: SRPBCC domain-containing protein [Gammaproteobacteria bacterium]|nr:SRPBCC domain-containing protein [Gammaproteobacteria bacterium]
MKFEIELSRTYPHPVQEVWRALTDSAALGEWLMETDFVPEPGREFQMWCETDEGHTDIYLCKVLEIEIEKRMLWSWVLKGREGDGATTVEFVLDAVEAGTRVTIIHRGDRDEKTIERFKGGWPVKLDQLGDALRGST